MKFLSRLLWVLFIPFILLFFALYMLVMYPLWRLALWLAVKRLKSSDGRLRRDAVRDIRSIPLPRTFDILLKVYENKNEFQNIRILAFESLLMSNPRWLPDIPGIEIVEEVVSELVTLCQASDGQDPNNYRVDSDSVREIGERINVLGGMELMLVVFYRFKKKQPPKTYQSLNNIWDGIGAYRR